MKQLAAAALALSMLSPAVAAESELQVSRAGARPMNTAPAQNFTGSVRIEMLYTPTAPEHTSAGAQYGASQQPAAAAPAQPSRAQRLLGDIAPKLAQLTDEVLFGDVWARPGLSPRDRSLVTVSALIAMNRPDQLRSHMALALDNGVSKDELIETLTHLAFYAGWPNAVTAAGVARDVFANKP